MNYIVKYLKNDYEGMSNFLQNHGFEVILLSSKEGETGKIYSKKEIMFQILASGIEMIKSIPKIRKAETIITVGYFSVIIMFMNRIHIISPKKIFWWSFFIHDKKKLKIMKHILPFLYEKKGQNCNAFVFSEYEIKIYTDALGIPEKRFFYIPYGDWDNRYENKMSVKRVPEESDYFFSGGYSNRDYKILIDTWIEMGVDYKLIIIGSKNNRDLHEYASVHIPNIKILLDCPVDVFEHYLVGAQACILPFKDNTGASGQSVTLKCMRLGKCIIASYTDVIKEYVIPDRTGFLLRDFKKELPIVIDKICSGQVDLEQMRANQNQLFQSKFSYGVITKKLLDIIG